MARTRDQFTGHVWLKRTGADRKYGQFPVWDMEEIQTRRRGEWRTICTARGRVAEEGSHDAIEVFYALRKGAPLTFHDIRLVDEKGRVLAGGDEEE